MTVLTELRAKRIAPGDSPIADGSIRGLWLHSGPIKGQGKWILRYVSPVTGKRRDMGLGTYPEIGLRQAREKGSESRQAIKHGRDPIDVRAAERVARKAAAKAMTFERAARKVHEDLKAGWANPKHSAQWLSTLQEYVFPKIGSRNVADLAAADFAEVLRHLWLEKAETAIINGKGASLRPSTCHRW
jgi:hypothetical protein